MVALNPPVCDFGQPAPAFDLAGVDGQRHTLASCRGPRGLLVMFICNHCPYVKAIIDRLIRDCRELAEHGIGLRGDHEQRYRRLSGRCPGQHAALG